MSTTWKNLETAPTGRKITGTDGTVYYVAMGTPQYSDADPRPFAYVQPGRGLTMRRLTGSEEEPVPAETPSGYARRFGQEPGPEWAINGRPFAEWVRVWSAAEGGGTGRLSDRAHVETTGYQTLTDAGRAAVEAWLTSPEATAELFSAVNLAECRDRDAARDLREADRVEDEARAALDAAVTARREAIRAAVAASRALDAVRAAAEVTE